MAPRKAVFLDRDGTLNVSIVREGRPYPPANLEELEICEEGRLPLADLKGAGFLLIVITNQPDIARGKQTIQVLENMHARLRAALPLDEIYVCCHDDAEGCRCRKPNPGLLLDAAHRYGICLSDSYMIGDRWKDIEAGHRAGCRTMWIDRGYREPYEGRLPHFRVHSLGEACRKILYMGKRAK